MLSVTPGTRPMIKSDTLFSLELKMLSLYSPESVNVGVTVIQPRGTGGLKRLGPRKVGGLTRVGCSAGNRSSGTTPAADPGSRSAGAGGGASVVGAGSWRGSGPVGCCGWSG